MKEREEGARGRHRGRMPFSLAIVPYLRRARWRLQSVTGFSLFFRREEKEIVMGDLIRGLSGNGVL